MQVGDTVKFKDPVNQSEARQRFTVLELRPARPEMGDTGPDRVLVRYISSSLSVAPTYVYLVSELEIAGD